MLSPEQQQQIVFTGGSGLLGSEFKTLAPNIRYPSSKEFNVTNYGQMEAYLDGKSITTIFHAAALTSPPVVEKKPKEAIDANIIGTGNVVKLCAKHNMKLIYVCTDYVFNGEKGNYNEIDPVYPVNKYAWSKLGGECAVRMYENSLIIRTSFGPTEFPYDKAFVDQWTSRESVDKIAPKMLALVEADAQGVVHVGGPRRTVLEYANELKREENIGELKRDDVNFDVPKDTSLDTSHFNELTDNTTS